MPYRLRKYLTSTVSTIRENHKKMNNRYLDDDNSACFSTTHYDRRRPKCLQPPTPTPSEYPTTATPSIAVQNFTAPLPWKTFFYSSRNNFVNWCLLLEFWKLWRCKKKQSLVCCRPWALKGLPKTSFCLLQFTPVALLYSIYPNRKKKTTICTYLKNEWNNWINLN